jgi:hypothetical protein
MFTIPSFMGFDKAGFGTPVDPDAAAFFARVTAAGGTLSATEQTAVNTLVVQMKADGTWTPMKAIYPMVGASAAACAQNLKSSSFTGTFSSGWTFASTGVTGNGSSTFFNTNCNPATSLTQNSTHISFYCRSLTVGNYVDMGVFGTSLNVFASSIFYAINSASYLQDVNTSQGFYTGTRSNATNTKLFKNGLIRLNDSIASTPATSATIYLGAWNNSPQYNTNREYALASIGDGLTDTQASNLYTAVQAFQTTLSRQV